MGPELRRQVRAIDPELLEKKFSRPGYTDTWALNFIADNHVAPGTKWVTHWQHKTMFRIWRQATKPSTTRGLALGGGVDEAERAQFAEKARRIRERS